MHIAIPLAISVALAVTFVFGAIWGRKIEAEAQKIEQNLKARVHAAAKSAGNSVSKL